MGDGFVDQDRGVNSLSNHHQFCILFFNHVYPKSALISFVKFEISNPFEHKNGNTNRIKQKNYKYI